MDEIITAILLIFGGGGVGTAVFAWQKWAKLATELLASNAEIKTGNVKIDAIVEVLQAAARATDEYTRSNADGTFTVEEDAKCKQLAAIIPVKICIAVEKILGTPIYSDTSVPNYLPVGGIRTENPLSDQISISDLVTSVKTAEQPAQPVSPPVA